MRIGRNKCRRAIFKNQPILVSGDGGLLARSAHRYEIERHFTLVEPELRPDCPCLEGSDGNRTQSQGGRLQQDVLGCVADVHVHVHHAAVSVAFSGALIDGRKNKNSGSITDARLPKCVAGQFGAKIT